MIGMTEWSLAKVRTYASRSFTDAIQLLYQMQVQLCMMRDRC